MNLPGESLDSPVKQRKIDAFLADNSLQSPQQNQARNRSALGPALSQQQVYAITPEKKLYLDNLPKGKTPNEIIVENHLRKDKVKYDIARRAEEAPADKYE